MMTLFCLVGYYLQQLINYTTDKLSKVEPWIEKKTNSVANCYKNFVTQGFVQPIRDWAKRREELHKLNHVDYPTQEQLNNISEDIRTPNHKIVNPVSPFKCCVGFGFQLALAIGLVLLWVL